MGLLEDVRDGAADEGVNLASVLCRCLILAHERGDDKFKRWATLELNGYPSADDLPDYRVVRSVLSRATPGGERTTP